MIAKTRQETVFLVGWGQNLGVSGSFDGADQSMAGVVK
jgi:hypothetical protein